MQIQRFDDIVNCKSCIPKAMDVNLVHLQHSRGCYVSLESGIVAGRHGKMAERSKACDSSESLPANAGFSSGYPGVGSNPTLVIFFSILRMPLGAGWDEAGRERKDMTSSELVRLMLSALPLASAQVPGLAPCSLYRSQSMTKHYPHHLAFYHRHGCPATYPRFHLAGSGDA